MSFQANTSPHDSEIDSDRLHAHIESVLEIANRVYEQHVKHEIDDAMEWEPIGGKTLKRAFLLET